MSDPIDRLNAVLEGRYRIDRDLGEGGWPRMVGRSWSYSSYPAIATFADGGMDWMVLG